MIKIRPAEDVVKWVSAHLPTWHGRAAERTEKDRFAGHYVKRSGIWSELKPFFVETQIQKCAYCESLLGSNGMHWQVEHYRPKARVVSWQPKEPLGFTDQPSSDRGYYLLAYNANNYLASCGSCNGPKHDYFPVLGKRQLDTTDASALASELPLLINPIDAKDDDPEDLIEFFGPIPTARYLDGISRLRAQATIELLNLVQDRLVYDRCTLIVIAWGAYQDRDDEGKRGQAAQDFLAAAAERRIAHSNCVRSFLRLCETNQGEARDFFNLAHKIVSRLS